MAPDEPAAPAVPAEATLARPRGEPPGVPAKTNPPRGVRRPAPVGRFNLRALGLTQGWYLGRLGLALGWVWLSSWRPGRSQEEVRRSRLLRGTRLVVATLGELKGAFVKAGQFAAIRLDLLPPEVQPLLASLRDRVPPRPISEVRAVLEAELGEPLEARFRDFESEPLGAASIAQVHRATLRDGTPVAVKVQYAWLERSLAADLFWLRGLLRWLGRRRRFDAKRLFAEFARGMAEEIDFEREAESARAIAENLADEPQVVVPEVYPAHSTRRVLTMRYHPCIAITDRVRLVRLGVDPGALVAPIARAYARQVFVDGLFHADPHPGNLFVLDEAGAPERPRVLFVDFGLSRRLDPKLRDEIRQAVYALLKRDPEAFLAGMDRLGMVASGSEAAVGASVRRMVERLAEVAPMGLGGSQVLSLKDEAKALLQETPGVQLPNDLLLYARTMTYVVGLGQELDPEADVVKLCLPPVLQFLAQKPEPATA